MSYILYLVVLVVSISSVIFGVDWLAQAPAPNQPAVHSAHMQAPMPPSKKTADANAKPGATSSAKSDIASAATTSTSASTVGDDAATAAVLQPPAKSEAPACNVQACETAYHTFRASDCTYQPYDGPRRVCDKGEPKRADTRTAAADTNEAEAQAQASSCNIKACEQAYQSFDPSDCTYQPYGGPRRLCER